MKAQLSNKYSGKFHQDFIMHQQLQPYQIDAVDADTTYMRFEDGTGILYIKKISTAGTVTTIKYSYDLWANRLTATYIAIND